MQVISIIGDFSHSNVYAVTQDGLNCILIDCANDKIADTCSRYGLKPCAVLLTHGHLDHTAGCRALREQGVDIYCGEGEENFIFSDGNTQIFGYEVPHFEIKRPLKDGEVLELCGLKIKVIATPGHSAGSVCYQIGSYLFTGDTLFEGSVGRCDFATGDERQLIKSVKKLCSLQGDFTVYPGHGSASTTLENERKYNPYTKL